MAALFDLMDFGFQTYNTMRVYQPTMRWIENQNTILQNEYYYKGFNIWY